jgi:predicted Zn-dependent protease
MTISALPQQPVDPAMAQALKDLEQSLAQALQLAVNHQQSGQLEEAETLYRGILQAQPDHPEANHRLGVLAVQMKQATAGLPHFAAALEARPEQQQYWLSYIDALIQADETETAQQLLALGRQHGLQGDDM